MYEKTHWLWNSSVELSALQVPLSLWVVFLTSGPVGNKVKFFAHEKELGRMF